MKLNEVQLTKIKEACESVDYGCVTIKLNKTLKFVDVVIQKQIRLENEVTTNIPISKDKKY